MKGLKAHLIWASHFWQAQKSKAVAYPLWKFEFNKEIIKGFMNFKGS